MKIPVIIHIAFVHNVSNVILEVFAFFKVFVKVALLGNIGILDNCEDIDEYNDIGDFKTFNDCIPFDKENIIAINIIQFNPNIKLERERKIMENVAVL